MSTNRRVSKLWQSHDAAMRMTGHNLVQWHRWISQERWTEEAKHKQMYVLYDSVYTNFKTGEINLGCWKPGELLPLGRGVQTAGPGNALSLRDAGNVASGSGGWPHWLMLRLWKSTKVWFKICILHAYCASIKMCLKCYLTQITWIIKVCLSLLQMPLTAN